MIISICLVIVLLFISSAIHSMTCQRHNRKALITKGKHTGREGNVVSYWPFDLMVCINTSPTEEDQQKIIQDRLKRNTGLKMPEDAAHSGEDVVEHAKNARTRVHTWRWKTKIESVNS